MRNFERISRKENKAMSITNGVEELKRIKCQQEEYITNFKTKIEDIEVKVAVELA